MRWVRDYWRRRPGRPGPPTVHVSGYWRGQRPEVILQRLVVLVLLFVVVSIWADPEGTARQVGSFLGDAGHFLLQVLDTAAEFLGFLTSSSATP
jgi:hypothetical protein